MRSDTSAAEGRPAVDLPRDSARSGERDGLRIVYVWDADYPWDVRTEKVCRALTDAGHEVHIVARNRAWRPPEEQLPEGRVHRMHPWRPVGRRADGVLGFPAFFSPRWRRLVDRVVRTTRADVVVARDLPLCPTAIRSARRAGIPVLFDMAENYPAMMRSIWEAGRQRWTDVLVRNPRATAAVERYCLSRVAHIVVVVEESRDRLIEMGVSPERITVVSNTPPRARAAGSSVLRDRPPGASIEIAYLGRMEIPCGILDLIEAMALLRDHHPSFQLKLLGKGRDLELFRARARALGLGEDRVRFYGFVPSHAEALRVVAESDIGAAPHRASEAAETTISNKLFDYMAAGLAVLSSDIAPCARVVDETAAGEVFRADDAASLAAALRRLSDPAHRARCGEAGRRAILDWYNWERESAVFVNAIEEVCAAWSRR